MLSLYKSYVIMSGCPDDNVFDDTDLKFRVPTNILIGGSSLCGKTTWILRLIQNYRRMFNPIPKTILYAYGIKNDKVELFSSMGVKCMKGLPKDEQLENYPKPLLLILDDLMLETNTKYLSDLFSRKTHHLNMATVFITQDLFSESLRAARKNSHYLVMMRAPAATNEIRMLAIQIFGLRFKEFLHAYEEATKSQYGYILVDLHPQSPQELRVRTSVFPDDEHIVFYN